jgi:hypothetical protein
VSRGPSDGLYDPKRRQIEALYDAARAFGAAKRQPLLTASDPEIRSHYRNFCPCGIAAESIINGTDKLNSYHRYTHAAERANLTKSQLLEFMNVGKESGSSVG